VARHLTLGYPPKALIATLARALLREDAGFYAYRMLEAGVRQFSECTNEGVTSSSPSAALQAIMAWSPSHAGMRSIPHGAKLNVATPAGGAAGVGVGPSPSPSPRLQRGAVRDHESPAVDAGLMTPARL
jgi:hypothetical protein